MKNYLKLAFKDPFKALDQILAFSKIKKDFCSTIFM